VYRTGDVSTEPRWAEFGARAHAETGVVSMMSLRLYLEDDQRIAGLNLYSTKPDAFDDAAQVIATVVATHTALALVAASAKQRATNLERALTSNRYIGMAMGVLMATHKMTQDDAFALLRIASQNTNRKLADVAQDVIQTGVLELPTPRQT
jgi:ANTAR domain